MQNYLKSTLKNLQNTLFLNTPNGFLFLDQAIWRMQKKGKTTPNEGGMVPGYLAPYSWLQKKRELSE
jgi:hypothetical protein